MARITRNKAAEILGVSRRLSATTSRKASLEAT